MLGRIHKHKGNILLHALQKLHSHWFVCFSSHWLHFHCYLCSFNFSCRSLCPYILRILGVFFSLKLHWNWLFLLCKNRLSIPYKRGLIWMAQFKVFQRHLFHLPFKIKSIYISQTFQKQSMRCNWIVSIGLYWNMNSQKTCKQFKYISDLDSTLIKIWRIPGEG